VRQPEGKQAAIRLGVRASPPPATRSTPASLVNQILSGGIESRIMRYVRAEKGLAYHAHAVFMPGRIAGASSARRHRDRQAADAITAMFEVLETNPPDDVTPDELTDAKQRVAGRMIMAHADHRPAGRAPPRGILNGYPSTTTTATQQESPR
jgi:predicted Zn-dependent peptidase